MKLTRIQGFFPYMTMVFFNTFIDIGHKILIQDTLFQTATGSAYTVFSSIINALILLPYIFLFTPSGFLADKFPKATVLKITAAAAIPLTVLVTLCYYKGYFWGAFTLTLLLAIQSAVNSPAKYGYIKEMFGKELLSQVNAVVQTLVIIAILGATITFTFIFSCFIKQNGLESSLDNSLILQAFAPTGLILIAFSIFETLMTLRLVKQPAADPESVYEPAKYFKGEYLRLYLNKTLHPRIIFTCIIGLSIFWAVNQVLLATYGAFLKEHLGEVSIIFAQGSLAMGGLGILSGALYAGKVSKGFIETGLIPTAAIGIASGLFILPHLTGALSIILLFLIYGFFGGMLIVPLNALIQFNSPRQEAGKVQSANNFVQNCFMSGFLLLTVVCGLFHLDSVHLLQGLFTIALTGALYTIIAMPQSLIRYAFYFIASRFYRLSVYQIDNLPSSGGVLLLGNHVSFIDWAVLQIACPRPIRFVMEKSYYQIPYLKWIFKKFNVIPIARGASDEALREINSALNKGEVVALFPEGRLSRNGQMGLFRSGFERSTTGANAVIIPFYIHGLWGSKTSYASPYHKKMQDNQRYVSVTYGLPLPIESTAREVRQQVKQLSIKAWKYFIQEKSNIQTEWLYKIKKISNLTLITDENNRTTTGQQLFGQVMFLKKKLKRFLKNQQNIGLMLPVGSAGMTANLSVLCLGKTLVNLNPAASIDFLKTAMAQAEIKTVLTSRSYLKALPSKPQIPKRVTVLFIEDLLSRDNKQSIFAYGLLIKILPATVLKYLFLKQSSLQSKAAILFGNTKDGQPKGIQLSHASILSNINQIISVIDLEETDIMMNCLPLYHSFGLTVTALLPLLKGVPMVCSSRPHKVADIAKLIYSHHATLFCSTSSQLNHFIAEDAVHPLMLSSLRLVIAGGEKLHLDVYQGFKDKFNLPVYEGYGKTEVAAVASCNLPDAISPKDWHIHKASKPGTVGLPLPGCAFRVVDAQTLKDKPVGLEGLILIGATQMMDGYLNQPEMTREALLKEEDDYIWFKTEDQGYLDTEGFLTVSQPGNIGMPHDLARAAMVKQFELAD